MSRVLTAAATVWCALYLVAYFGIIGGQDGTVAWWYVALIVLATLSTASATAGIAVRLALLVGLITSVIAASVALLSLGALLLPVVVAIAVALVLVLGDASEGAAKVPRPDATKR